MSPWRILFINPCLRKKAPTEILPMGLTDKTFIKPGGYKKHTTIKKINWNPDRMKRIENDGRFNDAETEFDVDHGGGK